MLGVSGPIAVVVAGIPIGNHGMDHAMSETTQQHLMTFVTLLAIACCLHPARTIIMWGRPMETNGLYRIRDAWIGLTTQHCVRVRHPDGKELDVPEDQYRAQEYRPPFDALPWKEKGAVDSRRV